MNRVNQFPLRLRLTLLMALILTVAAMLLLLSSIYAAREIYNADVPQIDYPKEPARDGSPVQLPSRVVIERDNSFRVAGIASAMAVIAL